jgi:hypothetical protein
VRPGGARKIGAGFAKGEDPGKEAVRTVANESEISSDEDELDEEDRRIAALEAKLGLSKKKNTKLGDEELDSLPDL